MQKNHYMLDKKTNKKILILEDIKGAYLVKEDRYTTVKFKNELEKYNPIKKIWKDVKTKWII